ncbi:MAG: bifunctional YncE family protein/alkaline phosphatase family protein [Acidobacteria bacterium]|nr:bifunctional YncE family protein/alkaline phosphatase family protein [Acidobacteriota bacterium]
MKGSFFRRFLILSLLAVLSLGATGDVPDPQWMQSGVRYGNLILVPSNQLLDPVGQRVELRTRIVDMALSPQGDLLALQMPTSIRLISSSGSLLSDLPTLTASFSGIVFLPDGERVAISQISKDGNHFVALVRVRGLFELRLINLSRNSIPAGLALDATGTYLYVALNGLNSVARIDLNLQAVVSTVDVGVAPFGLALSPQGDRLFVTNWGGRRPVKNNNSPSNRNAPSAGTPTLVDERGIASSGTVSVINLATFQVISEVSVGLHPSGIQISPDGKLAAVANANSDSVTLLDTNSLQVLSTILIPAFPAGYFGSSPTAVAFSPSGDWLYVACGGNNGVAVLEREGQSYRLRGFVPTDWYPVGLAVSRTPAGVETVFVANSKGVGGHTGPGPFQVLPFRGTLNIFPGGMASIAPADAVSYRNEPFRNAVFPSDSPANLRSLGLEHVFLIIKENRTYDQVLGDLGQGNGDPRLAIYGWDTTPNHHELALQFVTLDNFYTSGARSADGHQWLTQAMVTDYVERAHASFPRSYPFQGNDPLAFASSGFLWNRAQASGRSVRIYGEFTVPDGAYKQTWVDYLRDAEAPTRKYNARSQSPIDALKPLIERDYPAYHMGVPDVFRARIFLEKFREYETLGTLPNLVIIFLPTDHTAGTAPGYAVPRSMMADNDLALGRVVEAISKSRFWPRSAIFVVEDDSQAGPDHVDGHRTICLVISPYTRRGVVDSIHYNQTSVLRTIEELLGMSPMNKFDASALPMRSVFRTTPDLTPYTAAPNRYPLDVMTPYVTMMTGKERTAALQSLAMNFSAPDAAPEETLNRILWHAARGWNTPFPHVPHGPECPLEDD